MNSEHYRRVSLEIVAQFIGRKWLCYIQKWNIGEFFSSSIGRRFDPYTAHQFPKRFPNNHGFGAEIAHRIPEPGLILLVIIKLETMVPRVLFIECFCGATNFGFRRFLGWHLAKP
jgi:hypothetical protein